MKMEIGHDKAPRRNFENQRIKSFETKSDKLKHVMIQFSPT